MEARPAGPFDDASPADSHRIGGQGVGFRSLTENVDTTTPTGRLVFPIFGALGQFERDLIRERTSAGLRADAARGRKGGRPQVATPDEVARARDLIASGLTVREVAARLKIGKSALHVALSEDEDNVSAS